ncbi:unnamed protein product, partial [Dibothriocephalus latus]
MKARSLRRREDIRTRKEAQRLAAAAHRSRLGRGPHPASYWHAKDSSVRRGVRKRLPSFDDNQPRKRSSLALPSSAYRSAKGTRRSTDPRDSNANYRRSPATDDRSQSESPNEEEEEEEEQDSNWVDNLERHASRQQRGRRCMPGERPPSARPVSRKGCDQDSYARDRETLFEDSGEEEEEED